MPHASRTAIPFLQKRRRGSNVFSIELDLVLKLIESVELERDAVLKKDAPADEAEGMIRSLTELRAIGPDFATLLVREAFGRMARSPFIGAVLARETRPCPVAELVGVDRRVFRKVLRQLQVGAAADAEDITAVREDRSREIRRPCIGPRSQARILRKDLACHGSSIVSFVGVRSCAPFKIRRASPCNDLYPRSHSPSRGVKGLSAARDFQAPRYTLWRQAGG